MKPILITLVMLTSISTGEWKNLWPGDAPGAKPRPANTETKADRGILKDIEIPQYQIYQAEKSKSNGAAVIIFPGGGYSVLAADHEGHDYAKWLNKRGFTSIVVKYRVSGDASFGYQFPVPFLDARRAIRTIRANAAELGVDPQKIGVMGSSAGGHLASLCTTRFKDSFPQEGQDAIDQQNCRPDFSILIYPVISMDPSISHQGSRKNLLGTNPSQEDSDKYSTDKAVTPEAPPVFLLSTSDDMVDCRNSLAFAAACKAQGVPVTLHLFESGGHGYGLAGKGDLSVWPMLLEQWLARKFPAIP